MNRNRNPTDTTSTFLRLRLNMAEPQKVGDPQRSSTSNKKIKNKKYYQHKGYRQDLCFHTAASTPEFSQGSFSLLILIVFAGLLRTKSSPHTDIHTHAHTDSHTQRRAQTHSSNYHRPTPSFSKSLKKNKTHQSPYSSQSLSTHLFTPVQMCIILRTFWRSKV